MAERTTTHRLTERIRGEFNEMPGLQLTIPQAARLWGVRVTDCHDIVNVLVDEKFLRLTPWGTIVRLEQ